MLLVFLRKLNCLLYFKFNTKTKRKMMQVQNEMNFLLVVGNLFVYLAHEHLYLHWWSNIKCIGNSLHRSYFKIAHMAWIFMTPIKKMHGYWIVNHLPLRPALCICSLHKCWTLSKRTFFCIRPIFFFYFHCNIQGRGKSRSFIINRIMTKEIYAHFWLRKKFLSLFEAKGTGRTKMCQKCNFLLN